MFSLYVGTWTPFLCVLRVAGYSLCFYTDVLTRTSLRFFRSPPVKSIKGQNVDTEFIKCLCRYRVYVVHTKKFNMLAQVSQSLLRRGMWSGSEGCMCRLKKQKNKKTQNLRGAEVQFPG